MGVQMFFVTYVRRELRRRMRQAICIALGLALGVGLVVTVAAASAGVTTAQSKVLGALYGLGTDVTVTGPLPGPAPRGIAPPQRLQAGQTRSLVASATVAISEPEVAAVARLRGVAAAVGGIILQESSVTLPKSGAGPQASSFTVGGVDTGKPSLGPLSSASLASGHSFTAADADADVAVVDSGSRWASARPPGGP
jgi:putative ABC transport system permease protein